jgi:hypothetical protein
MIGRRNWPRFSVRAMLVFVAVFAVLLTWLQSIYSRGVAQMQTSAELKEYRIFVLEESQLADSLSAEYTPFNSSESTQIEIPVFKQKASSFVRDLIGNELFVDYKTVVIEYCLLPIDELEIKIAKLGAIDRIYCSPMTGFDETHIQRLQRRFPEAVVVKLDLPPDTRKVE